MEQTQQEKRNDYCSYGRDCICSEAASQCDGECLRKSSARLKVTGGGAKNEVWMQILADVLNTKVEQLESGAGAGYGIALCAAVAWG